MLTGVPNGADAVGAIDGVGPPVGAPAKSSVKPPLQSASCPPRIVAAANNDHDCFPLRFRVKRYTWSRLNGGAADPPACALLTNTTELSSPFQPEGTSQMLSTRPFPCQFEL